MSQTHWVEIGSSTTYMYNTSFDSANDTYFQFEVSAGTAAAGTCYSHSVLTWVSADVTCVTNPYTWAPKVDEKRLEERYDVEELPVVTPEMAREIELASEKFLADVLSPDELMMFKAENKVRIESRLEPEVHYIVKRVRMSRIERYVDGVLVETLGFHACWQELPELDILATKVFDLKHNEDLVLKKSCRAPPPVCS